MKNILYTLLLGASLLSTSSHAQTSLGYHFFDYGTTQTLGTSITIFDGALSISGRVDIADYYTGAGSLTNGTASLLYYQHDPSYIDGGVATSPLGIRGGFGQISELVFEFNGGYANFDSINIVVNRLDFGGSPYDVPAAPGYNLDMDDPMMWFNTNLGVLTFTEQQIRDATFFELDPVVYGLAALESGRIDFANLLQNAGFAMDTTVTSFAIRETNGEHFVSDVWVDEFTNTMPVPEPGTAMFMVGSSLLFLRRRRSTPLSSRRAVG